MGFVCVLVGFVLFLCDTYLPVLSYNCLGDFCLWIFALCTSAVWRITGWVWGEILHSIPLCGFKQYSNILPLRATDCDLWRRWNLTQLFRGPGFFFFCLSSSVKSVLHYFIPCRNLCKFSEIPSHLRFFSEEHMWSLCAVRLQESLNSFPFCSTSSVSQAYRMVLEPNFYTKRKQYAQCFNGKNFLVMDDSADPYHYTS